PVLEGALAEAQPREALDRPERARVLLQVVGVDLRQREPRALLVGAVADLPVRSLRIDQRDPGVVLEEEGIAGVVAVDHRPRAAIPPARGDLDLPVRARAPREGREEQAARLHLAVQLHEPHRQRADAAGGRALDETVGAEVAEAAPEHPWPAEQRERGADGNPDVAHRGNPASARSASASAAR